MIDLKGYEADDPRTMPILLLLDVSESMNRPPVKIDSLNQAVSEMIDDFKQMSGEMDFVVSVITFGGKEKVKCLYDPPYKNVKEVKWAELKADLNTPMGAALKMAKDLIDDKDTTKGSWYIPVVILVSDGQPNDKWEKPMDAFITEGRSSKSQRFALAIGQDADKNVLKLFLKGTSNPLFCTHDDFKSIKKFFKWVTMSVQKRATQKNKNDIPVSDPLDPSNSSNAAFGDH